LRLAAEGDDQLAEAVEQGHAGGQFADFGWAELAEQFVSERLCRLAVGRQERVGQGDSALLANRQNTRAVVVVDPVDVSFGESLLLRDREANVASIAAVGASRIAQSSCFLRCVIEHAVAPELCVEVAEVLGKHGLVQQRAGEWRRWVVDR
jgi:hypothetical protein